jgi:hypothetical protein
MRGCDSIFHEPTLCPICQKMDALKAENARLQEALTETRDVLDELQAHPESVVGRVLTRLEAALAEWKTP